MGSALTFDITGLDFALTALFIVLLVDQVRAVKKPEPYFAALLGCILALFISPKNFLLVALVISTGALALLRERIEGGPRGTAEGLAAQPAKAFQKKANKTRCRREIGHDLLCNGMPCHGACYLFYSCAAFSILFCSKAVEAPGFPSEIPTGCCDGYPRLLYV